VAWRDKYRIMLFGSFVERPAAGDVDQWYRVTAGTTNLGKLYKGTGDGWEEVPWPSDISFQKHELGGELHTGQLPISRVSGHTAFGPPAHRQAFAASILRRPK